MLITPVHPEPMYRKELVQQVREFFSERRNVLFVGPPGIGKTRLLQEISRDLPLQICDESSSLGRICCCLERRLGWRQEELDLIERKNRLLRHLVQRGEPVAFDHVVEMPPRAARFVGYLIQRIPVWIVCRSDQPKEIGHVWEYLYNFARIEVPPLSLLETSNVIERTVATGRIQADAGRHIVELYELSKGVPRVVEELPIELAARRYHMDDAFGFQLLELDRQIRNLASAASKLYR